MSHQPQNHGEIRVVTEESQVEIDGKEAEIEYDTTGSFTVNSKEVKTGGVSSVPTTKTTYNQLCVPYGKRATLTLSDGTMLWINAGKTVVYPTISPSSKREIYANGEIYAEVVRDESRPFSVKTENLEVYVLGTSFNLSAYKEDTFKRIVLVNGSVDIRQNGTNTRRVPNQSYTVTQRGNIVETVDTEIYTSWRNGIYIFKDEPIENILQQLGGYYNVSVILPPQPSGILCSGKLELKDEFLRLLNNLSQIASFNFSVKDNGCRIQFY